jgi:hypothetical protein
MNNTNKTVKRLRDSFLNDLLSHCPHIIINTVFPDSKNKRYVCDCCGQTGTDEDTAFDALGNPYFDLDIDFSTEVGFFILYRGIKEFLWYPEFMDQPGINPDYYEDQNLGNRGYFPDGLLDPDAFAEEVYGFVTSRLKQEEEDAPDEGTAWR